MTDVVIDATVVLKWFLPELDDQAALALLDRELRFHAPEILSVQVGQALVRRVKSGHLTAEMANRIVDAIPRLPLHWTASDSLAPAAMRIVQASPRTYPDALYFALAARLDAPVVSADRRWCAVVGTGPLKHWVKHVADFA